MKELVQILRISGNSHFIASFSSESVTPLKNFEPIIIQLNLESGYKEITKIIRSLVPREVNAYEIGNSHISQNNLKERFFPVIPYLIDNGTYKREVKARKFEYQFL
jgi:hypothetical protein